MVYSIASNVNTVTLEIYVEFTNSTQESVEALCPDAEIHFDSAVYDLGSIDLELEGNVTLALDTYKHSLTHRGDDFCGPFVVRMTVAEELEDYLTLESGILTLEKPGKRSGLRGESFVDDPAGVITVFMKDWPSVVTLS